MDFLLNGVAHGDTAARLLASGFNPAVMRPFLNKHNQTCVTLNQGGKPVNIPLQNAEATLRKDEWISLDRAVLKAAQARLRVVADLRAAGLTYSIPNGMGSTVLQTQTMSDVNDAEITMDGLQQGKRDRPTFDLQNLPLPIIHKDFSFSLREIQTSRNGGTPLDTTMAEECGRKVAETAEKLTLGTLTTNTFGGGTIYGLTNFPSRITQTITSPDDSGWTPATLIGEVLAMLKEGMDAFHYGPFLLYYGPDWSVKMNDEYKNESDRTLAERLRAIDQITDVRQADFLSGYDILLVQQTSSVIRLVIGMEVMTLQWDTVGGLQKNFKVMAIIVPQCRADQNGNTGIIHGSVSS